MDLISERLRFVRVTSSDIDDYLSWYTNDDVMKFITGRGLTELAARERFANVLEINRTQPQMGFYAVRSLANNQFVGISKIVPYGEGRVEIGYGSLPQFWKQKYASEMLRCLIEYASRLDRVSELIGIVNPKNEGSVKVLLNHSFKFMESRDENGTDVDLYRLEFQVH